MTMIHDVFGSSGHWLRRAVLLACGVLSVQHAFAQAPPTSVTATAEGPNEILLQFVACQTSEDANCEENFYVYRKPPGLNQVYTTRSVGQYSQVSIADYQLHPSTTYAYLVCTDEQLSDQSNCVSASATTWPPQATPPAGSGGGTTPGTGSLPNSSPPPTQVRALAGDTAILLTWQNPQPETPETIWIDREIVGGTAPGKIAVLNPDGTMRVKPTRYEDQGPLLPHYSYSYYVCSGQPDITMRACGLSNAQTAWGLAPVINAARISPTVVRLSVAVDNLTTLSDLKITRQDNSTGCGNGAPLANGEQGCGTRTYGANGVPMNGPIVTTIYDQRPTGASTASAPYVIDIPDDTVSANVTYYYQAQATWNSSLQQDSQTVTVAASLILHQLPNHKVLATVPAGIVHLGPKAPAPKPAPAKVPASAKTAVAQVKATPNDPQALYALGKVYCAQNLHDACVNTLYMALLQTHQPNTATALGQQIKASLASEGIRVSN